MPSRFEFERAIRRSELPPLSRLLALTIATWADAETGVIARRNQPAQSVLLEATGLSKSAFLTHRKNLTEGGWLRCDSPDPIKAQKEHAQNVYFILVPDGKAGSSGDLAKADKRPGKRREPRSPDDLALGRHATQPNGTEPAKSGLTLGRQATTRVLSSSPISHLPTDEGGQASSETRIPLAFDYCQPLIKAMTEAGIVVSWTMGADDWQAVARVLDRAGVDAMVTFARGAKSRDPIRFAKFFLKAGWTGLPPKSAKPAASSASKPAHCGHPDCDPITRTREIEDARGIRSLHPCAVCHPNAKGQAA